MPFLQVETGDNKGSLHRIWSKHIKIGRSPENDVVVHDKTVSSVHAAISLSNGIYTIEDNNSANGTYLNGKKIRRKPLNDQDQILIGKTHLRFIAGQTEEDGKDIPIARADSRKIISDFSAKTPSPKSVAVLRQVHENLKRIYEINGIISSIFDISELTEKILDIIFTLFQADRGYIMLLDKESSELKLVATKKRTDSLGDAAEADFSRTIAQRVLEQEESIITSNAPEDDRFGPKESIVSGRIKSAMCVPIRGRDEKLGIIYVDHRGAADHFTQEHLQLLTMVANSAGIALDNIRLYEENLKIQVLNAVNEEMRETNRKLMELEALKEDLINMVVHDMKNPVTNTMMGLDLITYDKNSQLSEQQMEYLQLAKRNLFKLSEMIMNLLELSKLESGRMQIEPAALSLHDLLNRVLERYMAVITKEEQTVHIELDPAAGEVISDGRLVERIFANILSNAIKHSQPKGRILVNVAPSEDGEAVSISVRDFGEGIPKEFHQKIFEKFCQAGLRELGHRTDTGLGLAFCKMAVEALDGSISVESAPKKGSCFTFSLPLKPHANQQ